MRDNFRVLVLGDASIDWHIIKAHESSKEAISWSTKGGEVAARPGGSRLLRHLIQKCLNYTVLPLENEAEVSAGLLHPAKNIALTKTMTICAPFLQEPKSKIKVLRIESLCGFNPPPEYPPLEYLNENETPPNVVVIDDSGIGVRFQNDELVSLLSAICTEKESILPWIILKVAYPVLQNSLIPKLAEKWGRKLIVIVPVDDLRNDEIQLSRGLSWERTAQDLSWEYHYNPRMKIFEGIHTLIVPIGLSGVWFSREYTRNKKQAASDCTSTLVFDPLHIEGDWEKERPGILLGYTSCLTMAVVRELSKGVRANFHNAIQAGLSVMRALHTNGYHIDSTCGTVELPIRELQAALKKRLHLPAVNVPLGYRHYSVPAGGKARFACPPDWSIMRDIVGSNKLFKLAMWIVLQDEEYWEAEYDKIPYATFAGLRTADRREIESYRAISDLMRDYCKNTSLFRPLSLAVFGPPGSGKSWSVSQVAKSVAGEAIEKISFNVSQFASFDDLIDAFHRVRDIGLSGKIPLVFWDEFDSEHDGIPFFWLKYFLAPMQDGEFAQGQITHPIGRAIFVFAGGTAFSVEELGKDMSENERRAAKIPDFKSRLRGCVNIVGIERQCHRREGESVLENDPQYIVRRAIVLRSIIERSRQDVIGSKGEAKIDPGLLKALLRVWTFRHGVRSLESIVELCHLGDAGLQRSSLPPQDVLALHVDVMEFLGLVTADVEFRGEILEKLAKAHHEMYRNESPDAPLAKYEYNRLCEADKDKNRDAVRDIPHKLASIGYRYELHPSTPADTATVLPDPEAEQLARLEHDRWIIAKIDSGYAYGTARTDREDVFPKRHPDLVPWDEMDGNALRERYPEAIACKLGPGPLKNPVDMEMAKKIPLIMASAGFRVFKE